ncbi:NAD(P)-dependent oxidoreductase [Roseicyclus sp.]|uniref:NAD(P)-dependent oxidoreductase n=1 Tax=Roseicyclus sp. TaxID=1914329 RepID=UPI001BCDD387|nr:NAD(P)-dependent oxidoreductase [Roseicyclus sp.]
MTAKIAMIGFGEAATAFVSGWALDDPARITAFDVKSTMPEHKLAMAARQAALGVTGVPDLTQALTHADLVFCLITADRAAEAAEAAAATGALRPGALWCDGNSCAPDTKRQAARAIEGAGAHYIDMAIMAPVYPKKHLVPIKLAGAMADAAALALASLGMRPEVVGDQVGDASTIKMLRSVMIKGLEALVAECFLSARRAGVEQQVIASLEASDPDIAWRKRGAYNIERMMVHGARRAAEMREVAKTVEGLGLSPGLSQATAAWQDIVAATHADPGEYDLIARLDRVLARL